MGSGQGANTQEQQQVTEAAGGRHGGKGRQEEAGGGGGDGHGRGRQAALPTCSISGMCRCEPTLQRQQNRFAKSLSLKCTTVLSDERGALHRVPRQSVLRQSAVWQSAMAEWHTIKHTHYQVAYNPAAAFLPVRHEVAAGLGVQQVLLPLAGRPARPGDTALRRAKSHGLELQSLWIIPMDNPYCSCELIGEHKPGEIQTGGIDATKETA